MSDKLETLIAGVRKADSRSIAKAISILEDQTPESDRCLKLLFPHTGRAFIIGVTGSPGAGKSSLVNKLVIHLSKQGKKCAVLAVDPSSPFTGGALLGDRIRMADLAEVPEVFIRSMASRGSIGGIAPRTTEAAFALDAAGYEYIFVETVGVGQLEIEVVRSCDCLLLVMMPGMGDEVQAMKAGIIESADIFVINKADRDGVDFVRRDLKTMLSLNSASQRSPEIVETVATAEKGIAELCLAISHFRDWLKHTGAEKLRKREILTQTLRRYLAERLVSSVLNKAEQSGALEKLTAELVTLKTDPGTAAKELIKRFADN